MIKIHFFNGDTSQELETASLHKAQDAVKEMLMGDVTAFAWIESIGKQGTVHYTIDAKGNLKQNSMGHDSWMALTKKEVTVEDQTITIKHHVEGQADPFAISMAEFRVLRFTYVGREYPGKPAIVSEREAVVTHEFKTKDGKLLYNVAMSLRPEDRHCREDHQWDFRRIYPEAAQDVVVGEPVTKDHPAVKLLWLIKGNPEKLSALFDEQ